MSNVRPFLQPVGLIPVVRWVTFDPDAWAADAVDEVPWTAPADFPADLPVCGVHITNSDVFDVARPGGYAVVVPPWAPFDSGHVVTFAAGRNRLRRWDGEGAEPGPVVGKVIGVIRMVV